MNTNPSLNLFIFKTDKTRHILSLLSAIALISLNFVLAISLKKLIDGNFEISSTVILVLFFLSIMVLADLLTVGLIKLRSDINKGIVESLSLDFIDRIENHETEVDNGFIYTGVSGDITNIGNFASEIWRTLLPGTISLLGLTIFLVFKYNFLSSLFIILSILPLIFLPVILKKSLGSLYKTTQSSNDKLNQSVISIVENSNFLQTVGLVKGVDKMLDEDLSHASKSSAFSSSAMLFLYALSFNNTVVPITFIAIMMFYQFIPGSIGDFFELVWIIQLFSSYIVGIPTAFSQFIKSRISYLRLQKLENKKSQTALNNFHILREKLKNYSKLKLIVEKYYPIDWHQALAKNLVTNDIGIISSNSWLINGSIAENISVGSQIYPEKILSALDDACISIEELQIKDIHESSIELNGANLSTGQRSRILLARLIYQNKQINFIEKLVSTLDASTAKNILANLSKRKGQWIIVEPGSLDILETGSFQRLNGEDENFI